MQNHVRPEGLIPGNSGHGTPAETAPRSAAPEAPAPACGFPREKAVCRGFFLPGAHAFPAFCRCAPTAYFTPYFSLFPENSPRVRPRTSPAFSPDSLPGTTPALRRCAPAPFSLVFFPFSPAHLPLPASSPAPGPPLFRHSLSRSPAPVCGFLQAAPLPHGLRTADPISLSRTLPRIRPEAVRDAARMFSMQDDKELRRTKFLTEKGRLKISRSPHLKKNIKQYAAVYLLDISIRNFSLKHLAILGKISSTSRKTAQPA